MKYFALGVLHNGRLYRNSLVWLDREHVCIKPFDGEVPQTIFVSGLIAACLPCGCRMLRFSNAPY